MNNPENYGGAAGVRREYPGASKSDEHGRVRT